MAKKCMEVIILCYCCAYFIYLDQSAKTYSRKNYTKRSLASTIKPKTNSKQPTKFPQDKMRNSKLHQLEKKVIYREVANLAT